jgi:hypothetical protein
MNIEEPLYKIYWISLVFFYAEDARGYFFKAYNKSKFSDLRISIDFVQDNQSFHKRDATWFTLSKSSFCSKPNSHGCYKEKS